MNGLIWFTNNLRIADNEALYKACKENENTIGVYCFAPSQFAPTKYGFKKTEQFRARFLLESVAALQQSLKKYHIPLIIYLDEPENCLPELCSKYQITTIYHQKEWTSEEITQLKKVQEKCTAVKWVGTYDQFLIHPSALPYDGIHQMPDVFTSFRKKVEAHTKIGALWPTPALQKNTIKIEEKPFPTLKDLGFIDFETHPNTAFPFAGGEQAALQRLNNYIWDTQNIIHYKETRNGLLGLDYSSKLSAWLANGSISAKTIYWEVQKFEENVLANDSTYWLIFELLWRDFFKYISLKHGSKIFQINGILQHPYTWKQSDKAFDYFRNGQTPEPFVNANMIELQKTGWMSNRGRQNVASFWAKEWQQDWRIAAAYFESYLIDYDVHSNYGNWCYNAGVGNDPRDRKFNIGKQATQYDPNAEYRNTWLP